MATHRQAELSSIALHQAVAERLDAHVVAAAWQRLEGAHLHPVWAQRWRVLLDLPLSALREKLVEDSQEMIDLRQCTPFAGVLDPRERWRILRSIKSDEAR